MRILMVAPRGGAFTYILKGYENAFRHLGHDVAYWKGDRAAFQDYRPDVYIGRTGWRQDIPHDLVAGFGTRVAIHVNPFGTERLDTVHGNRTLNEPPDLIDWTAAQRPDLVYGLGWGDDADRYWDRWRTELGLNVAMIPTAGDPFEFYRVPADPKWRCDLAFVGGRWRYKANHIDSYLMPLMGRYDIRVHGWGGWATWRDPRSFFRSTRISDDDVRVLFSSARIGPVVHEPHTGIYGIDVPERVFKVPLCGLLAISDPSASLHRYFPPDILPMADTPRHYRDLIDHYLADEDARVDLAARQRAHVLAHHTYLNRAQSFLSGLGLADAAAAAGDAIASFQPLDRV